MTRYAIKNVQNGSYKRFRDATPNGVTIYRDGPKDGRNLWSDGEIAHACVCAWNRNRGYRRYVVVRVKS